MNVQRYARIAGVLFLLSLVAGGFGEAYVPSKLIVAADPAATVANLYTPSLRLGWAAQTFGNRRAHIYSQEYIVGAYEQSNLVSMKLHGFLDAPFPQRESMFTRG